MPPVTAERSPPASRITGADSPVMAASFTEATPSMTSPSEGMMSPASTRTMSPDLEARAGHEPVRVRLGPGEELGLGLGPGSAQRVGLRLAAPFRDRLGEVGEQNREPEPQDDLEGEAEVGAAGDQVADEESRDQGAHDLDHEHDRVLDQDPRVELAERAAIAGPDGVSKRLVDLDWPYGTPKPEAESVASHGAVEANDTDVAMRRRRMPGS